MAGEYHCTDFTWESRVADGEAAVARQLKEVAAWKQQQQEQRERGHSSAPAGSRSTSTPAATAGHASTPAREGSSPQHDRGSWEEFHSTHSQARFFKERRYLLLEFPQLGVTHPPQHFVELGCGCGSSLLPVLRANPNCR